MKRAQAIAGIAVPLLLAACYRIPLGVDRRPGRLVPHALPRPEGASLPVRDP